MSVLFPATKLLDTDQFKYLRTGGPLIVGDAQEAIDKIMGQYELFGNTLFLAQLVTGHTPHHKILKPFNCWVPK